MHLATFKILLVDDEPAIRRATRRLLEIDEHTVTEAPDGATALSLLARERFDVVVTDLRMPTVDGWGVIREIAKMGAGRPSVIAVTGAAWENDPEMVAKLETLGVANILRKPFTRTHLRYAMLCAAQAKLQSASERTGT